jgi:hypothetical protein
MGGATNAGRLVVGLSEASDFRSLTADQIGWGWVAASGYPVAEKVARRAAGWRWLFVGGRERWCASFVVSETSSTSSAVMIKQLLLLEG